MDMISELKLKYLCDMIVFPPPAIDNVLSIEGNASGMMSSSFQPQVTREIQGGQTQISKAVRWKPL